MAQTALRADSAFYAALIYELHNIYDTVCLLLVSFCRSVPPEFLRSFLQFLQYHEEKQECGAQINLDTGLSPLALQVFIAGQMSDCSFGFMVV